MVRGEPTPVLDLRRLLGAEDAVESARRLVTLRIGSRRVGLLVDAVRGVELIALDALQALPPLLGEASAEIVTAIGRLDEKLLLVLEGGRLLPEAVWKALDEGGAPA